MNAYLDPKFNFRAYQKKYWFNDDPVMTLFANATTATIPYGEKFVIVCVLPYIKRIQNKVLRKSLIHFIRQEANHSREHFRFYRQMVKPFYPKLRFKEMKSYRFSQIAALLTTKKLRIAMVAAVEHLTAITGIYFLNEFEKFTKTDDQLLLLWQWHFVEEVEHSSVAYDLLQEVGCGYFTRIFGFLLVTFYILVGFFGPFLHMMIYDKLYKQKSFYHRLYQFFLGKSGVFRRLAFPYLRYLKPKFYPHPNTDPEFQARLSDFANKVSLAISSPAIDGFHP